MNMNTRKRSADIHAVEKALFDSNYEIPTRLRRNWREQKAYRTLYENLTQ